MLEQGSIDISPARARDLRAIRTLQKRAFRANLAYGLPTLTLLWAIPSAQILVARHGNEIVGCAIGDRNGDISRVVNIAVDPGQRRQGIGEQLLAALERALPVGDLILMVQEENTAAQALYQKSGYRKVGDARNYYGKGEHGIWMRKVRAHRSDERIFV
jgi:ribosomal-protein-alanine N-acetyltransferase